MGLNLLKVLRDLGMYPDHWHSWEEPFFYHGRVEKESRLIEREEFHEVPIDSSSWKSWIRNRTGSGKLSQLAFVDGVRRIHRRLYGSDGAEGGVAEIAIGHVLWKRDGGINPCKVPRIKRLVALPGHKLSQLVERSAFLPLLEKFSFELICLHSEGEDTVSRTINNYLLSEESAYLRELAQRIDAFIVKDGTMHPGAPLFKGSKRGPVGLVKRILREHLPAEILRVLSEMRKGDRTPFYAVYLREREDMLRIMSYLRISNREDRDNPMKGIVRLEALVLRTDFENDETRSVLKKEISSAFDSLAETLSSLTLKGCDLPRSPENLPIISSLERWLSSFFLPSDYIGTVLEGGIST